MGVDAIIQFTTNEPLSQERLQKISYRLAGDIGKECFWINDYPDTSPMIKQCKGYDDNEFSSEEKLIPNRYDIPTLHRYYGIGYERGPILTFINIAEWLEACVPELKDIYYGGDSSEHIGLFNKPERDIIKAHFYKVGHLPYRQGFSDEGKVTLCPRCNEQPIINSWSGGTCGGSCYGCTNIVTIKPDSTALWYAPKR